MAQFTIPEAAAELRVSIDTVRRRIRAGELYAQLDSRGRYLVEIPNREPAPEAPAEPPPPPAPPAASPPPPPPPPQAPAQAQAPTVRIEAPAAPSTEVAHLKELLEEIRRQRDSLLEEVAAGRRQLEEATQERAELRRLLANTQAPLTRLLPAVNGLRRQLDSSQELMQRLLPPLENFGQDFEIVDDTVPALPAPEPAAPSRKKRPWWNPFAS
jgi:hypothetical protein